MYDYGNARIAAARSRLPGPAELARLAALPSLAELAAALGRDADAAPGAGPVPAAGPGAAAGTLRERLAREIERLRSERLRAMRRWYPEPVRRLVDALALPVDVERLVAAGRRRVAADLADAGEPLVASAAEPGLLLDPARAAALDRAQGFEGLLAIAARAGVLDRRDARAIGRAADEAGWDEAIERQVVLAAGRVRRALVAGGEPDGGAVVAALVDEEDALRARVAASAATDGLEAAAELEREAVLARLDALARRGRRDPLGIGAVAGYVAAVDAAALRLRAAVEAVAARAARERPGGALEPSGPAAAPPPVASAPSGDR